MNSEETYPENDKSAKTGKKLERGKLSKVSFVWLKEGDFVGFPD